MKQRYLLALLLAIGPNLAQAQAPTEVLHPAQTIALGPKAKLGSTLLLPNHNTVLLLVDPDSPTMVAQCLAPDGHTLWKTSLACYDGLYTALTQGNEVIVKRTFGEMSKKRQKAGETQFREGQNLVQRLDAQGQLTQHLFEPLPLPAGEKKAPDYLVLTRYADADSYVEIVQEMGRRRDSYQTRDHRPEYFIQRYNLQTKAVTSEPLVLPAVPTSSREYAMWYTEWAFLGRYQDKLYFCRRSLKDDTEKRPGRGPLLYYVLITDGHGQAAPGGFTTAIDLGNADLRPAYSGLMRNNGDGNHIPRTMVVGDSKIRSSTVEYGSVQFDAWDVTTGGMGAFYLDQATGEVLIYGEYTDADLAEFRRDELRGLFLRRYAPDGRLLAQSQTPYSADMLADKKKLSFKSSINRNASFHADPLTGQYHYLISPTDHWGNLEDFDLLVDHDLKWQRYDYYRREDKHKDKRILTRIFYTQPYDYASYFSRTTAHTYEQPHPTDPPVYAALAQLRRPYGPDAPPDLMNYDFSLPKHLFFLSATGAGKGLVVEQAQPTGGTLKVYTF
jgi:hypothetical protein